MEADPDAGVVLEKDFFEAIGKAAVVLNQLGGCLMVETKRTLRPSGLYDTEQVVLLYDSWAPADDDPAPVEPELETAEIEPDPVSVE